jgi:hypothetical protein
MRLYSLPGPHILLADSLRLEEISWLALPGTQPRGSGVRYFGRPKTRVPNGTLRNSVLNSSANIVIVTDLECPDLPQPYDRLHPAVKCNPAMICEPQINFAIHGLRSSCDCVTMEVLDVFHRQAVLPLLCCKRC